MSEVWVDEHGTAWTVPTAWAYAQACKARDKWQTKAEILEGELAETQDKVATLQRRVEMEYAKGLTEAMEEAIRLLGGIAYSHQWMKPSLDALVTYCSQRAATALKNPPHEARG